MRSNSFFGSAVGSIILLLAAAPAEAHPGVGIVQDQSGSVFFTDLRQVWRITADGQMSVWVPDVHTHELCLDAEDNLYGEHVWGAAGGWRHRVWCKKRDGTLLDVIPARQGFPRDYGFVRDGAGNLYWADRSEKTSIKKRSPGGRITTHATAEFRVLQWMTATRDGTLFLIDGGDLRRVAPDGKVTTVVTRLSVHKPPPSDVAERNYHMGLWTDRDGSVYVAVSRERLVLRVEPHGKTKVVARSGESWSPSGGMIDSDGNLWLLEYDTANVVRARCIGRDGHERTFSTHAPGQ
jgi:sugar lactone lactonase YvrE